MTNGGYWDRIPICYLRVVPFRDALSPAGPREVGRPVPDRQVTAKPKNITRGLLLLRSVAPHQTMAPQRFRRPGRTALPHAIWRSWSDTPYLVTGIAGSLTKITLVAAMPRCYLC